jgi:uncharacterized membrane protein YedE/YeeE
MSVLAEATRSPYAIGAGLGLLNVFAFASAGRGLGITTPFESAAALLGRRVAPDAMHINDYLKERDELPKLDWEAFLVLGVFAGSYLATTAARERARSTRLPAPWRTRFGPSLAKRYASAFLGGALMMFGARMAKGCTSGHGLTGSAQLAASSWVFTPLMFASAALAARLLYGKEVR